MPGRIVVPVVVHHVRGIVVTMVGSLLAVASALAEIGRHQVVCLADQIGQVGQIGQVAAPSPAVVGTIGIAAGLITAVGGIAIQVLDRANNRRRSDQAHSIKLYIIRRGCDELINYSKIAYSHIREIQGICAAAGIRLPSDPGPPPSTLDHESGIHGDDPVQQAAP